MFTNYSKPYGECEIILFTVVNLAIQSTIQMIRIEMKS